MFRITYRHTDMLKVTLVLTMLLASLAAQGAASAGHWVVGTKESPPFVIKQSDGSWSGISIELWEQVAARLGLSYELREYDLKGLVSAVTSGEVDAGVAALTVTPEREQSFDFTHPFYTTGLAIAVQPGGGGIIATFGRLVSREFLISVGLLCGILLGVGLIVWLLERRANPEQFGGGTAKGIESGFWWSAVTMTTVGYGDKAPITRGGRFVGLLWMFASVIIISGFTGAIASSLTVGRLEGAVRGPADLPSVRVVTVTGSTSEAYLQENRVSYREFASIREGLESVAAGKQDAMVYDAPLLRYLINSELQGRVEIVPGTFHRQDYAIALPEGSPAREEINRELIALIQGNAWQDLLYRYLGE